MKYTNRITYEELYVVLTLIFNTDQYLSDCFSNSFVEEMIYLLENYDLIWIASNNRILLTSKGEKVLQFLISAVELSKKSPKLYIDK